MNLASDAVIQPLISAAIEITIWWSIFHSTGLKEMNGFPPEHYLTYALWAAFFARISTSWMYEFIMTEEINTGRINTILSRPISFYEFYLGQLMGYKFVCLITSFGIPILASFWFNGPTHLARLPLAIALLAFYLILVHTISFAISSLAFHYNRIHAITSAKNIALWVLSGEFFPLDLVPEPFRGLILKLPFSAGVYVPVAYITGRVDQSAVWQSFLSVFLGILVLGVLASLMWKRGIRLYSGTGA